MTRRMIGPRTDGLLDSHRDEHDWDDLCDSEPECIPVRRGTALEPGEIAALFETPYDPPPFHYQPVTPHDIQPWDVVDAFGLSFYEGNVLKYLLRAGKKDTAPRLDDLKKCRNYLNKLIELEEQKDE